MSLSYSDAVSFALMEDRDCDAAMSFDADFTTAGFALWRDAR
jgi:predicted nucleic acid-binding protein